MVVIDQEKLRHALIQELCYLEKNGRRKTAVSIRPIILKNLARGKNAGRVGNYLTGNPGKLPCDYVGRVADYYEELSCYLQQIQEEKSDQIWEPLFEKMQWLAYNYLRQKNFMAGQQTFQLATDCAADAGGELVQAYFPYDTDFDPWACTIVQNHCKKTIARLFQAGHVPENKLVNLANVPHRTANLDGGSGGDLTDWRLTLYHLIDQLPAEQLETILLHDFKGMTLQEIGYHLGISTTTAHRRYFAAIDFLRKNLVQKGIDSY
jgi:RNA polymerase sigma factor (sigma-70 family)